MDDSPKWAWVEQLPSGEPDRVSLGRLVEQDHDPFETELYEAVTDPELVALDRKRRQYRGAFLRRLRRLPRR
jgi:hypothetical protein